MTPDEFYEWYDDDVGFGREVERMRRGEAEATRWLLDEEDAPTLYERDVPYLDAP